MAQHQVSKVQLWSSRILQGILSAMFLLGAGSNLIQSETAVKGAMDMGYPGSSVLWLGVVFLISTLLYIFPKTAILGAILLTAWLGGAVATHVIHGDPMSNIVAPAVFGVAVWAALWLRMPYLRKLAPIDNMS